MQERGTLILESGGWWKNRLLPALVTAAVSCLVTWLAIGVMGRHGVEGIALQAGSGILLLLLLWFLYPAVCKILPQAADFRTASWRLTDNELVLDGEAIPLERIVQVHQWDQNDSVTVNIETKGKNYLLKALSGGEQKERSVRLLLELVETLRNTLHL